MKRKILCLLSTFTFNRSWLLYWYRKCGRLVVVLLKRASHSNEYPITNTQYGRLVWGKVPGSRIWPGIIIDHTDCGMNAPNPTTLWMFWFGDDRITEGTINKVYDFIADFKTFYFGLSSAPRTYKQGILEILRECKLRAGMETSGNETMESLVQWAFLGFPNPQNSLKVFLPPKDYSVPPKVKKYLNLLLKNQDSSAKGGIEYNLNGEEFPTSSSSSDSDSDSEDRKVWRSKASLLKKARTGLISLNSLCIACEKVDCVVVASHPYFEGGLCDNCCTAATSLFSYSTNIDYGSSSYCCVCSSPGQILLCDNPTCDKVFCVGCVELFVSINAIEKIKKIDPWHCFLCTEYNLLTHGLLIPRPDWKEKCAVAQLRQQENMLEMMQQEEAPSIDNFDGSPLRVLSLFDGIGTGLFILKRIGFQIESYHASEIDESAINVSKVNFGSSIQHTGDIQMLTDKQIEEMCPLDLLIGGSPCNDLSYVNPNRKGLYDPTGSGILFFHFFRILKVIQASNKGRHLFWLFENVSHMPKEYRSQISLFLQRPPVVVDAQFFSPQKRARYFWGNIPDMYKPLPEEILSQDYKLQDYVLKECNRDAKVTKINCVTTNSNSLLTAGGLEKPIQMGDQSDTPWITELEEIFGFNRHFTDCGNLGVRERQLLLGRAWSVPVVQYLLSPLKKYYPLLECSKVNK